MTRIPICSSCGVQIIWAITALGKRMPIDRPPDPERGNVALGWSTEHPDHAPRVRTYPTPAAARAAEGPREPLRTSHFATCDHANDHRRRRAVPPAGPAVVQPEPVPEPYEQGALL